jgi:hypothetical protein
MELVRKLLEILFTTKGVVLVKLPPDVAGGTHGWLVLRCNRTFLVGTIRPDGRALAELGPSSKKRTWRRVWLPSESINPRVVITVALPQVLTTMVKAKGCKIFGIVRQPDFDRLDIPAVRDISSLVYPQ